MNKSNQFSLLCACLSLFLLITSCKPDEPIKQPDACPPKNQLEMWNCHHEKSWDKINTRFALIGLWEWKYMGCFWVPELAGCDSLDRFTVEFRTDNTLIAKENGNTIETASWTVVDGDADLFEINTNPSVQTLYGRILFCEDIVEFNHSYIDGCDNYFKRIQ